MNVVIVIDSLAGGGAEKVMLTLAQQLIKEHCVTILSLADNFEYAIPEQIKVESLFTDRASKVDRFWKINKSVAKLEAWFSNKQQDIGAIDLVLSNLDRSNNLLAKSAVKNVHFVMHNSVNAELARQKKLGPFSYRYLKKSKQNLNGKSLVCVSKGVEQEINQGDLITPSAITTIYNPFDLADIKRQSNEVNTAIPQSPYLIHVGRLAKQKRHDILFAAFAKLDKKYKLVLLCNKPVKAFKLAKEYGIEEQLIVPGFEQNPYNWIKHAQALVLSSDFEGLPTVLIEALAVGTPVVSTNCTFGPSEILTGELANYLVPVGNSEELSAKIKQVLANKPNVENAEILQKVNAELVAQQYLALSC
ncbi:glycosyltransferase [Pseudoalteromonas carrageenovora]|uniref:glycosyltransferase n=1 Tax=Pseudoalteromonas carrageenovora TaxID=227 RepID=UPI002119253E|nr:glycosyltransferase [Pseudoalteromonas carrageenovora]MCQ8891056.1 glycosyltransferase [Pseudoalteromonas carrageenovora]MDO6547830.1 glycosyltransferase [Pseudoalteromonas carrageenovora]MDO6832313.1 glycosyltransferase [Pseudoalteromonas carrageenovora]